ncbi:MAG: helix-turn-helix transcriptional regulator [Rhodobiaceae bacterium]|nr:helix-turn-helix transcriptional regulator [Rhodobiaceae bacterium]
MIARAPALAVIAGEGQRADRAVPAGFERNCTMGDTITLLTRPWAFLILREAFFGARRYSQFVRRLAIPRATLAATLAALVDEGLLVAESRGEDTTWKNYRLTGKSRDLFPVFLGFMWFGDKWLGDGLPPLALFHKACGSWFSPRIVWAETGEAVDPRPVAVKLAADYWRRQPASEPRRRRVRTAGERAGGRPCSVERLLSIVGDRWTFLILREFFHGNTQFQDFLDNLPISSSILSGRLGYLVSVGFIERGDESARSGYALTRKGLDIYGPMILMKHWGDAWLRDGKRPAMQFVDARSRDERTAVLVCSSCGEAPDPRDVAYRAGYDLEDI